MKKAIMKLSILLSLASVLVPGQTPATVSAFSPPITHIPKHLVYAHFLTMVNNLNNQAVAAGQSDPYYFSHPFARAGLSNAGLDALLAEAKALTADLAAQDVKAKILTAAYRASAKAAAQQGKPLPPLPVQIRQLQAERTAFMVNHMLTLQTALGSADTASLEAYLAREVTPNVSLKVVAHPPVDPAAAAAAQSKAAAARQ